MKGPSQIKHTNKKEAQKNQYATLGARGKIIIRRAYTVAVPSNLVWEGAGLGN